MLLRLCLEHIEHTLSVSFFLLGRLVTANNNAREPPTLTLSMRSTSSSTLYANGLPAAFLSSIFARRCNMPMGTDGRASVPNLIASSSKLVRVSGAINDWRESHPPSVVHYLARKLIVVVTRNGVPRECEKHHLIQNHTLVVVLAKSIITTTPTQ